MKICWDNLEGIKLTKNGFFIKKGNVTYIYKEECVICKQPYLMNKHKQTEFCSNSCSHKNNQHWLNKKHTESTKKKMSLLAVKRSKSKEYRNKLSKAQIGNKNSIWKGGVSRLGLPLYETYAYKLWNEKTRFIIKKRLKLLEVKCTKCKIWFIPKVDDVQRRMKFLNDKATSEGRFYCSNKCKSDCSIFRQVKYPKGFIKEKNKNYTNYELSIWSSEVLKRVNYFCEICGEKAEHAHHIIPKKEIDLYILDPDNGMACCKKCHYKYGHKDDCSTGNLANKKCK